MVGLAGDGLVRQGEVQSCPLYRHLYQVRFNAVKLARATRFTGEFGREVVEQVRTTCFIGARNAVHNTAGQGDGR